MSIYGQFFFFHIVIITFYQLKSYANDPIFLMWILRKHRLRLIMILKNIYNLFNIWKINYFKFYKN